jgi:hypothetical protein
MMFDSSSFAVGKPDGQKRQGADPLQAAASRYLLAIQLELSRLGIAETQLGASNADQFPRILGKRPFC